MSSSSDNPSSSHPASRPRRNEEIRSSTVRLISQGGQDLGIMKTDEVLKAARSAGLDLVEMARTAVPPACKIFDYEASLKIQRN
jgi:translation initiation factor IF-3